MSAPTRPAPQLRSQIAALEERLYAAQVAGAIADMIQDVVVDMTVSAQAASKTLIHLLFCLVWRREGAQWRLLYRQATRIP